LIERRGAADEGLEERLEFIPELAVAGGVVVDVGELAEGGGERFGDIRAAELAEAALGGRDLADARLAGLGAGEHGGIGVGLAHGRRVVGVLCVGGRPAFRGGRSGGIRGENGEAAIAADHGI
jgi:hypothetical protein